MTQPVDRRTVITGAIHVSLAIATGMLGLQKINITHAAEKSMTLGKNATPRQVAESYWRAECAHDIEGVGRHYHADAVFMPPGERLVGWPNIRKWYEEAFRQFPDLEVEIVHEVRQGNEAALEWSAVLIDPAGVRHPLTGVNVVRIEDGKYREVRAYFDASKLNVKTQS